MAKWTVLFLSCYLVHDVYFTVCAQSTARPHASRITLTKSCEDTRAKQRNYSGRENSRLLVVFKSPDRKIQGKIFHGLGYSQENWEALAMEIKYILEKGQVTKVENTDYGKKYIVEGQLKSPTGSREMWLRYGS